VLNDLADPSEGVYSATALMEERLGYTHRMLARHYQMPIVPEAGTKDRNANTNVRTLACHSALTSWAPRPTFLPAAAARYMMLAALPSRSSLRACHSNAYLAPSPLPTCHSALIGLACRWPVESDCCIALQGRFPVRPLFITRCVAWQRSVIISVQ